MFMVFTGDEMVQFAPDKCRLRLFGWVFESRNGVERSKECLAD